MYLKLPYSKADSLKIPCDVRNSICSHGATTRSFVPQSIVFQLHSFPCKTYASLHNSCMNSCIFEPWIFGPWNSVSWNSAILSFDMKMLYQPISCHWSLLIPPENIRKPLVFWCFQGVSKEISGMKWINSTLVSYEVMISGKEEVKAQI